MSAKLPAWKLWRYFTARQRYLSPRARLAGLGAALVDGAPVLVAAALPVAGALSAADALPAACALPAALPPPLADALAVGAAPLPAALAAGLHPDFGLPACAPC